MIEYKSDNIENCQVKFVNIILLNILKRSEIKIKIHVMDTRIIKWTTDHNHYNFPS